jgi:hypothetical protein
MLSPNPTSYIMLCVSILFTIKVMSQEVFIQHWRHVPDSETDTDKSRLLYNQM